MKEAKAAGGKLSNDDVKKAGVAATGSALAGRVRPEEDVGARNAYLIGKLANSFPAKDGDDVNICLAIIDGGCSVLVGP